MKATVIIPTFDHSLTLKYSIPSVLNQTVKDIEIFIIGDGVSDKTRKIVKSFMKQDKRIKFFDNPKDKRHGEIYRHQALKKAKGKIVCYLGDDDMFFPTHIQEMLKLLENGNFCNTFLARINSDGEVITSLIDLKNQQYQKIMMTGKNFVGLSFVAHTLSFYRKLPFGWRTSPLNIYTDLYMWQQFLSHKKCFPVSGYIPTVLHFPSPSRKNMTLNQRVEEMLRWSVKINNKRNAERLSLQFIRKAMKDHSHMLAQNILLQKENSTLNEILNKVTSTKIWKFYQYYKNFLRS